MKQCDVLGFCLGENDVADYLGEIPKHMHDLVCLAIDLHEKGVADKVGFVEGSSRLGENSSPCHQCG